MKLVANTPYGAGLMHSRLATETRKSACTREGKRERKRQRTLEGKKMRGEEKSPFSCLTKVILSPSFIDFIFHHLLLSLLLYFAQRSANLAVKSFDVNLNIETSHSLLRIVFFFCIEKSGNGFLIIFTGPYTSLVISAF